MFLVGGGILTHGVGALHHAIEAWSRLAETVPGSGRILAALTPTALDLAAGIVAGAVVVAAVQLAKKTLPRRAA